MKDKKIYCSIVFLILIICGFASASAEEIFLFSRPLSGIYLVKGDSEEIIIHRQGSYVAPRLSPDGERVLFHSKQDGEIGIWLTDLYGKEMKKVCHGDQANWSFDGQKIIFRRDGRIIERDIGSGTEKIISPENWLSCEFPSYLPDERMLFVSDGKIFLASVNNDTSPEFLAAGDIRSSPRCSSDGKIIAYQDGPHIYLMNLDNRKITQLTTAGGVQSCPIWSSDGLSLCYCQSADTLDGPWDICNVRLESPNHVSLVMRDVELSPDWRGSSPSALNKVEIKGNSINLWQVGESLDKKNWKALTIGSNSIVEGEVAVENDWIIFHLSSKDNKLLVFPKEMDSSESGEIELSIINQKGITASKIESISASGNDGENVVLNVAFRSEEGDITKAIFTVSRSRPLVGIKPVENMGKVYIKKDTRLALLPDRFADDLIFDPHKYSTPKILLPHAPLLMGLPDNKSMFLVISPLDSQEMWLIKGEKADSFAGVEILTETTDIFVSPLSGSDLWHQTEVNGNSDTKDWRINWSYPFLAQWRAAVMGGERYYSRGWNEETLNKLTEPSLPIEGEFSKISELSIIYLYGRTWNTPLEILAPVDIMQDALGIEKFRNIMDIDGIRTYRTAEKGIPLHNFLTSQENRLWPEGKPGWPQTLDFSPIYQLLIRIRMVDRNGVESTTTHLCDDILNSLTGLDDRIQEYEQFLTGLVNFHAEQDLFGIREGVDDLRDEIADIPVTGIQTVSDSIEAIMKCLGSGDELWDKDEFNRFKEISESALSERQDVLIKYRNFVKQIRNNAGVAITKEPKVRDMAEEIRNFTHNILRDRYYLEGDWRGEKPLE